MRQHVAIAVLLTLANLKHKAKLFILNVDIHSVQLMAVQQQIIMMLQQMPKCDGMYVYMYVH